MPTYLRREVLILNPDTGVYQLVPSSCLIDPVTGDPVRMYTDTFDTGQVTVTTAATPVMVANPDRNDWAVTNLDAAINIWVGKTSGVTVGNGYRVKPDAEFFIPGYRGAIFAIATSGTPKLAWYEA